MQNNQRRPLSARPRPSHQQTQPSAANPSLSLSTRRRKGTVNVLFQFLCRIDVCWTLFFFVFLVGIAATTTSITQTKISAALLKTLHDTHNLHIVTLFKRIDLGTQRLYNMAAGFLTLHSQTPFQFRSEDTMSTLCSILNTYDITLDFNSLAVTSMELKEAISCMHGDGNLGSRTQLYGWITENSVIPGVYLISNSTFRFDQPLKPVYGGWPTTEYNLSNTFNSLYLNTAVFREAAAYFNGRIKYIDYRTMWRSFATLPHIIYCTIPAGFLFRGLNLPSNINVTDYVDVRVNGAGILITHTSEALTNITAAIFINASLTEKDPLVMSNNWGQPSVNDTEILSTEHENQVTYLAVSDISNPLMRAALKHIDLKGLQQEGHNQTVDFQYRGAPATVTAATLMTERGLVVPMVFVSSNAEVAGPYRRIMDICNGVTAVVIVAFTALFWWFLHRYLHQPLQGVSDRMLRNLRTGRTLHMREPPFQVFQLTETHALLQAHRDTVNRLREIRPFVPRDVQDEIVRGVGCTTTIAMATATGEDAATAAVTRSGAAGALRGALLPQLSTLVQVTVRPCGHAAAAPVRSTSALAALAQEPGTRQRLAAVVAHAARAVELVNSGPFPTPACLESFAVALQELCEEHGGTVHRLAPDSCAVHFGRAARAHVTRAARGGAGAGAGAAGPSDGDAARDACAARDARCALRFAFALLRWVDGCGAPDMPDVRVLVDTSEFVCGRHRPRGSEQTLAVALGRDVQRVLGHVPALIGVRVAMTEETATLVRAGAVSGGPSGGVRQIPVEAFRVGRAELDADVVILFEALPGPVVGDEAWRLYSRCCTRAFSSLVRGDYAGAMSWYVQVASISDLEPGLLPSSMRREAASSDAVGGAVSVQVQRLMRECVQRVARGNPQPYVRSRRDPLGIDAVLGGVTPAGMIPEMLESLAQAEVESPLLLEAIAPKKSFVGLPFPRARIRRVVELKDFKTTIRAVIGIPVDWIQDNNGLFWKVALRPVKFTPMGMWMSCFVCLHEAGGVANTTFLAFRNVPVPVANAIRDAPLGPMSDALRSATPVFGVTPKLQKQLHGIFYKQFKLDHPNLMVPLSYSTSLEGGGIIVWQYNAGGTLRELTSRYYRFKPITAARFIHGVTSALAYLHLNGLANGAVNLDNVLVGADGVCRLRGHLVDKEKFLELFVFPQSCYLSPVMAAGVLPTPACDIFCFGLMCIELLCRAKAWMWAAVPEGEPQRTEEELGALMAAAEQPFFDAVADGRIVANTAALDGISPENAIVAQFIEAVRACVWTDPSQRPSAADLQVLIGRVFHSKDDMSGVL